jgi:dehydrogenase/reductase SDR family protein 13
MAGKVALVTGANTGIGRITARELARLGAHVVITCRNQERAEPVLQEIRAAPINGQVSFIPLELGSFASIRRCADSFIAMGLPLHVLVNNAGLAGAKGLTKEGFEMTFGVNHIGTFLLTQLLTDHIKASAPARIVTVASRAHIRAKGIDWNTLRSPGTTLTGYPEYTVSKLANVLFSAELGRRLQGTGVNTYALHPGVVATDVWRSVPWPFNQLMKLGMITAEEGALTSLHCATSPAVANESGFYYDKCKAIAVSQVAQNPALARDLWERSEAWVRAATC